MLQINYNNGATGIGTVESSSLSVMRLGWLKIMPGTAGLRAENFHVGNFSQPLNDIVNIELILM